MTKLFNLNNSNNIAFVIPQEQGGTEDDTGLASIGDATEKHVHNLSHHDRQLWQDLIHTRSGNIFRAEPSLNQHDSDPFALRGKELDKELKTMKEKAGDKLDDITLVAIKEAFEAETERQEKSEDAYDQAELIPYHLMEQYPGMEKHIDIPQTPKDWLFYMGNTRQQFMDEFPEGHPDSNAITSFIRMLDRDEANEGYYDWVRERLADIDLLGDLKSYVVKALWNLIDKLESNDGDNNEHVQEALLEIDRSYRIEYLNVVAERSQHDYILQLLIFKTKEWNADAKKGFNVYSSIKAFGRVLFENYRDQMNGYHWAKYRKVRDQHVPQVIARGVDINRCNIQHLKVALRLTQEAAVKLWHARPFSSLGQIRNQGYIDRASFADSKEADICLSLVENAAKEADKKQQMSILSAVAGKLVQKQQLQKEKSPEQQYEWRMVWSYYRILRDDLTRKINDRKKENDQQEARFSAGLLEDIREEQSSSTRDGKTRPEDQEESREKTSAEVVGDQVNDSHRELQAVVR